VFEKALRGLKPFAQGRDTVSMQSWLLKLAGQRLAKESVRIPGDPQAGSESERVPRLRERLRRLPARQQAALSLALFEALPPEEIAGGTGQSLSAAMRTLRRALRRVGTVVDQEQEA
jgi:DNA-directed RNA polymerase specialized sigma24 family protein